MKVFDAMTGVNRATYDGDRSICSVSFSPDDGFLVSELLGGTINVWDVQTGTIFRTFKWNMPWRSACLVAFSSCGTMIASGGSDGIVRIWNISSGGCDCVFQGHSRAVMDVCWPASVKLQLSCRSLYKRVQACASQKSRQVTSSTSYVKILTSSCCELLV